MSLRSSNLSRIKTSWSLKPLNVTKITLALLSESWRNTFKNETINTGSRLTLTQLTRAASDLLAPLRKMGFHSISLRISSKRWLQRLLVWTSLKSTLNLLHRLKKESKISKRSNTCWNWYVIASTHQPHRYKIIPLCTFQPTWNHTCNQITMRTACKKAYFISMHLQVDSSLWRTQENETSSESSILQIESRWLQVDIILW
jgi:hypothetical protein